MNKIIITIIGLVYFLGLTVGILNSDLLLTSVYVGGACLVAGIFFGRWTEQKDSETRINH